MSHRQAIMTVLRGGTPDLLPWAPRLDLWYKTHQDRGTLPAQYASWPLWDIYRHLRLPIYVLNGPVFREERNGVERRVRECADERVTEYITPLGSVTTRHVLSYDATQQAAHFYQTEHMIKTAQDYDVVLYMIEHTRFIPTYDEFLRLDGEIGEDGVVFAYAAFCPMHQLIRLFAGYERVFLDLHDRPAQVERILSVLANKYQELQAIVLASPAEIVKIEGNLDANMTNPRLMREYFVPPLRAFADRLHQRGKLVACHADGEMTGLLELSRDCGFDLAEAFTPPPMTRCTVRQARQVWGDQITIWGGIASNVLCPETMDEAAFDAYLLELFDEITPGDHFVLGLGDNMPTNASFERLLHVSELVERYGSYPVRPSRPGASASGPSTHTSEVLPKR